MNRLWTATVNGESDLFTVVQRDCAHHQTCYARVGSSMHIPGDSLADPTPVRIVPITAQVVEEGDVVIKGVTAEELNLIGDTAYQFSGWYGSEKSNRVCQALKKFRASLMPPTPDSLAPSATQEGGAGKVTSDWHKERVTAFAEFNRVGNALTDENLLFVAQFLDKYTVGRGGYEATVLRAIATLILTKLNPPRMEEPKEFGAVVLAVFRNAKIEGEPQSEQAWIRVYRDDLDEWLWQNSKGYTVAWSDLITPKGDSA